MKRNLAWGSISLLLLLSLFLGTSLESQGQSNLPRSYFSIWDSDGNQKLTHAEFYDGLSQTGLFEHWDDGQDGYLVRQEFFGKLEQVFPDFSASLEQEAASEGNSFASYFPEGENFTALDLDSANETLFRIADLNRNGKLNKAEFYTMIFRYLDQNENGFLGPLEGRRAALARWFIM